MGAIGNSCFHLAFKNPLENGVVLMKNKSSFKLMVPSNSFKVKRISCQLSESGVEESPTSNRVSNSKNRMEDYNTIMKTMMRNPYEYHHDLGVHCLDGSTKATAVITLNDGESHGNDRIHLIGMNYTLITDHVIVGSQPQKPEDVDHLKQEENVAYILNLQQDKDVEYWGVDLPSIIKRCKELDIRHMRRPARDFDPDSLRNGLPKAVSSLEWAISEGKGKVYVHCTAGLGRAPAVAIAYMFWFCGMNLNTAYNTLTSKRPCGPSKHAIRGATYDLAKNDPWKEQFENLPEHAFKDVADWERNLIQDRVRSLRGT